VIGDTEEISPRGPSTCVQNATLSLMMILIIPSCQIYVAIDNLSVVCSVSCHTTRTYLRNYFRTADDVFHIEKLPATAAVDFLTCTNFEKGSKLPQFSGIVMSAKANKYSTKAPSSPRRLFLNSLSSCHGRRLFSAPYCLPRCCFTHTPISKT